MNPNTSVEEWRRRARRRLPRFVFDYLDGGADDESCLTHNIDALKRIRLLPDRLTDVSTCKVRTDLFGVDSRSPIIVAPTGLNGLLWRNGDLALGRAAAKAGVPFVLSTASTSTIESVGKCSSGDKWFQLYVLGERRFAERLMQRARSSGFRVLLLTVDVPISGHRVRDARNGFTLPLAMTPKILLDAILHPRWCSQIAFGGLPKLVNVDNIDGSENMSTRAALIQRTMDRSLTWTCIDWLRAHWSGPVVLKGLLSARDAQRAVDSGVDGIVVSNHGGRQLDAAPATIDALHDVVDAVGKRISVLIDSGFRSGSDIVKALALGARAVLIGRPALYGLAADGEDGACSVLERLRTEIERTVVLTGLAEIGQLERRHLTRTPLCG